MPVFQTNMWILPDTKKRKKVRISDDIEFFETPCIPVNSKVLSELEKFEHCFIEIKCLFSRLSRGFYRIPKRKKVRISGYQKKKK